MIVAIRPIPTKSKLINHILYTCYVGCSCYLLLRSLSIKFFFNISARIIIWIRNLVPVNEDCHLLDRRTSLSRIKL